jgi:hypothetical protein
LPTTEYLHRLYRLELPPTGTLRHNTTSRDAPLNTTAPGRLQTASIRSLRRSRTVKAVPITRWAGWALARVLLSRDPCSRGTVVPYLRVRNRRLPCLHLPLRWSPDKVSRLARAVCHKANSRS